MTGLYEWDVCKGDNIKLELPDCWNGSCRGMRMRVSAEQKNSYGQHTTALLASRRLQLRFEYFVVKMQQSQLCHPPGNVPVSAHCSSKTEAKSLHLYRPGT